MFTGWIVRYRPEKRRKKAIVKTKTSVRPIKSGAYSYYFNSNQAVRPAWCMPQIPAVMPSRHGFGRIKQLQNQG
jgi:hypothetical protein